MKVIHRYNSKERQHFVFNQNMPYSVKPHLLYAGKIDPKKGWRETDHCHNFVELILVLDGSGYVYIDNVRHFVNKGDIVIYNAGQKHHEVGSLNNPFSLNFIAFDNIKLSNVAENHLISPNFPSIYATGAHFETFENYASTLINELVLRESYYTEIISNTLRILVAMTYRLINNKQNTASLISSNKIIANALVYLDLNYLKNFTIEDVAQYCFTSKFHLIHLFKKIQGITILDYIMNKRINYAKNLLKETNSKINEISLLTGFNNLNYFCKSFKKIEQCTPTEYRNNLNL